MAARNNTTIHVESAEYRAGEQGGPGFVIFNGFLDCDGNMCRVPPGRGGSDFCHVSRLVAETLQMDNVRYNIR